MLVGERADYLERRAEELGATVEVCHLLSLEELIIFGVSRGPQIRENAHFL